MREKQNLGPLAKLAAIASALTAILTLVFLLCPDCRPKPSPDQSSREARRESPSADQVGALNPDPSKMPEALDPEAAQAIRDALAAYQAAEARIEPALRPLDVEPPAGSASPAEQVAYLAATAAHFEEAERVVREQIAATESVKLASTPAVFREAFQALLAAWRDGAHVCSQTSTLATRAALDVRTRGSAAYEEFFTKLGEIGQRGTEIDNAEVKAWADVKAAALAVGIE